MCGLNAIGVEGLGCRFKLYHTRLKMGGLLHEITNEQKHLLVIVLIVVAIPEKINMGEVNVCKSNILFVIH